MSPRGDAALDPVLAFLRERAGLVYSGARLEQVETAVRRAMAELGVSDPERFVGRVEADPAALDRLLAEATVGETYFFREPEQWEYIRRHAIPEVLERRGAGHALRAWSAACSTGEEPYTLSILCHELGLARRRWILGTDVSRPRLAVARAGRYSRWSLRGVPEAVVRAYFTRRGQGYELDPALRAGVEFRSLNLAGAAASFAAGGVAGMDLVICRNVLIYLEREAVARVAARLLDALADGGWLFTGASDPPLAELAPCEVVVTWAGLAYRKPRPGARRTPAMPSAVPAAPPARPPAAAPPPVPPPTVPATAPAVPAPPAPSPAGGDVDVLAEAERAYAERDYPRAAVFAWANADAGGDDARAWVLLVRALANGGELAEAASACLQALERHRTSAELHYLRAVVASQGGQLAEAASAVRQALYLDPELVMAHLLSAAVAQRTGNPAAARRALRNAERLLVPLAGDEPVPASDGEVAGHLLRSARAQLALLSEGAA